MNTEAKYGINSNMHCWEVDYYSSSNAAITQNVPGSDAASLTQKRV